METAIASLNQNQPQVAAILLEPLQGEGGVNPGNVEYFQKVRQLCDQHKILLILDEVQVGMGRTGKLWGYENLGIEPDVLTLAKGLAGGIPIGAMLCKESCNVFEPGDHASTFGGNPFASAAALCVCQTIEAESIIENVRARGEQLRFGLKQLAGQYPDLISEVRGWGLINGVVLEPSLKSIDVVKAAMTEGLLLVPAGPQVVRFVPPLVVSAIEIECALATVNQVLAHLSI
jgi:acetylornithine/N-succinyldiaminopimelate aminotransferase